LELLVPLIAGFEGDSGPTLAAEDASRCLELIETGSLTGSRSEADGAKDLASHVEDAF
jgi:hypothetical protein